MPLAPRPRHADRPIELILGPGTQPEFPEAGVPAAQVNAPRPCSGCLAAPLTFTFHNSGLKQLSTKCQWAVDSFFDGCYPRRAVPGGPRPFTAQVERRTFRST